MAYINTGSGFRPIIDGQIIWASHVLPIVHALDGTDNTDISIGGSVFKLTGIGGSGNYLTIDNEGLVTRTDLNLPLHNQPEGTILVSDGSGSFLSYGNYKGFFYPTNYAWDLGYRTDSSVIGNYSLVLGTNNVASAENTLVSGDDVQATIPGEWVSGNSLVWKGDTQTRILNFHRITNDNLSSELTTNNLSANIYTPNVLVIPSNPTLWNIEIKVSAFNVTDDLSGGFVWNGIVRRKGTSVYVVGTPMVHEWFEDESMESIYFSPTLEEDPLYDYLRLEIKGLINKTVKWHATVSISQVVQGSWS